jgi:hypothetical protein
MTEGVMCGQSAVPYVLWCSVAAIGFRKSMQAE